MFGTANLAWGLLLGGGRACTAGAKRSGSRGLGIWSALGVSSGPGRLERAVASQRTRRLERAGRLERARATPAGRGGSSGSRTVVRGGGRGPGGTARSGCWLPLQRRRRRRCAGYGSPHRLPGMWRRWRDRRMHTPRPWRGLVYARAALLHGLPTVWCWLQQARPPSASGVRIRAAEGIWRANSSGRARPACEFELNVRRERVWAQAASTPIPAGCGERGPDRVRQRDNSGGTSAHVVVPAAATPIGAGAASERPIASGAAN